MFSLKNILKRNINPPSAPPDPPGRGVIDTSNITKVCAANIFHRLADAKLKLLYMRYGIT